MSQVVTDDTVRIASIEDEVVKFASLFAHDLEGPLVSIRAVLKLIDGGRMDLNNPTHQALIKSSHIAIERAQAIVHDLLQTAKMGVDNFDPVVEKCCLTELVSNSCYLAHPAASEQNIRIISRLPRTEINVNADPLLVNRVIDNLIYNAIRHTPPNGVITVSALNGDGEAEVSVRDTGPGLHGVNPEELFTVFKQIEHRSKGKHRGVGIGLYFCRIAIEKMGGAICAANRKDRGSIFRFTLPVGG